MSNYLVRHINHLIDFVFVWSLFFCSHTLKFSGESKEFKVITSITLKLCGKGDVCLTSVRPFLNTGSGVTYSTGVVRRRTTTFETGPYYTVHESWPGTTCVPKIDLNSFQSSSLSHTGLKLQMCTTMPVQKNLYLTFKKNSSHLDQVTRWPKDWPPKIISAAKWVKTKLNNEATFCATNFKF